jgi:hypothetical protein
MECLHFFSTKFLISWSKSTTFSFSMKFIVKINPFFVVVGADQCRTAGAEDCSLHVNPCKSNVPCAMRHSGGLNGCSFLCQFHLTGWIYLELQEGKVFMSKNGQQWSRMGIMVRVLREQGAGKLRVQLSDNCTPLYYWGGKWPPPPPPRPLLKNTLSSHTNFYLFQNWPYWKVHVVSTIFSGLNNNLFSWCVLDAYNRGFVMLLSACRYRWWDIGPLDRCDLATCSFLFKLAEWNWTKFDHQKLDLNHCM